MDLNATFGVSGKTFGATLTAGGAGLNAEFGTSGGGSTPTYTGPTVFTPTNEAQTVACKGLKMPDNVTIEKIPSNYGLITYTGFVLRVS